MEYSVELKQRLIYNEISQSDLAKMLSVSKSAVSQWISGECVPSQKYKNFINEKLVVPEKEFKNVTVRQAARMLGKSEQFIRIGLQRGFLTFGSAVKNGSKYSYHISPYKLFNYIGYSE